MGCSSILERRPDKTRQAWLGFYPRWPTALPTLTTQRCTPWKDARPRQLTKTSLIHEIACAERISYWFALGTLPLWQVGLNWHLCLNFEISCLGTLSPSVLAQVFQAICCLPSFLSCGKQAGQAVHSTLVSCSSWGSRPRNGCKQHQAQQSAAQAWHHKWRHFASSFLLSPPPEQLLPRNHQCALISKALQTHKLH